MSEILKEEMRDLLKELAGLVDDVQITESGRESLKKEIDKLTEELKKAEESGDKEKVDNIKKRLKELKDKLEGYGYTKAEDEEIDNEKEEEEMEEVETKDSTEKPIDLGKVIDWVIDLFGLDASIKGELIKCIEEDKPNDFKKLIKDNLEPKVYEKQEGGNIDMDKDTQSTELDELKAKIEELIVKNEQLEKEKQEAEAKLEETIKNQKASTRLAELMEIGLVINDEEAKKAQIEFLKSMTEEGYNIFKSSLVMVKEALTKQSKSEDDTKEDGNEGAGDKAKASATAPAPVVGYNYEEDSELLSKAKKFFEE